MPSAPTNPSTASRSRAGPATTGAAVDQPLWHYQQVAADYQFLPSTKNPLGFICQMREADQYGHFSAWKTVDNVPAFVIRPLLIQLGLLGGEVGMTTIVQNSEAGIATSRTNNSKASTGSRV